MGFTVKRETSIVTTKGQLVIPAKLRRRLNIQEGTVVVFSEEGGKLIIQPVTPEFVRGLRGSLKGEGSLLRALAEDRKKEASS